MVADRELLDRLFQSVVRVTPDNDPKLQLVIDELVETLDVVERYARRLESEIRASPADWLWVHNKWKYPRPAVEEPRKRKRPRRAA